MTVLGGGSSLVAVVICFCSLLLYSNWLYAMGFFTLKSSNSDRSSWSHYSRVLDQDGDAGYPEDDEFVHKPKYPKLVSKLVFVVIDGMRNDMIANLTCLTARSAKEKYNAGSMFFVAKAETPTVTMPRIKAIMTGDVPAFVDVFTNMDAKEFVGDSLIDQWYYSGLKTTMFGDETWNRLWGNKFTRSDPVTFFVNEYTEVDLNVSRNLEPELKRDDWHVMILHFGGLDHIGHLYGTVNSLMPKKLAEMNEYLEMILKGLYKEGSSSSEDWMLIVTSDHGQADGGGHGGPTDHEVMTPLAFVSPLLATKKVGKKTKTSRDKTPSDNETKVVKQIDLTSTLAFITGVPIPALNTGCVISDVLERMKRNGILSMSTVLNLMNYNSQQIERLLTELKSTSIPNSVFLSIKQARQLHQMWIEKYPQIDSSKLVNELRLNAYNKVLAEYVDALRTASNEVAVALTKYENVLVYISLCIIWTLLFAVFTIIISINTSRNMPSLVATNAKGSKKPHFFAKMLSSTPWLITWSVFVVSFSLFILCITATGATVPISKLIFYLVSALAFLALSNVITAILKSFHKLIPQLRCSKIVIMMLIHSVLLTSSSFIEEEHNIVYFLAPSLIWVLFYLQISSNLQASYLSKCQFTEEKGAQEIFTTSLQLISKAVWKNLMWCLICLLLLRNARSWNQTGDKWLSYPDLGDWMLAEHNQHLLPVLYLLATTSLIALLHLIAKNLFITIISSVAVYFVIGYQSSAYNIYYLESLFGMGDYGLFYANYLRLFCSFTVILSAPTYAIYIFLTNKKLSNLIYFLLKLIQCLSVVYCLLLQIPQDFMVVIILLGLTYSLKQFLGFSIASGHQSLSLLDNNHITVHLFLLNILSRFSYFALGNSNSFTTVDIQTAYTGLADHNLLMVVLHLFIVMFTGPIIVYSQLLPTPTLLLFSHAAAVKKSSKATMVPYDDVITSIQEGALMILLYRCLTCSFVLTCSWLLRYHIMTWTVFSPKVVFEIGFSLFDVVISLLIILFTFCKSHFHKKSVKVE